MSKTQKRRVVLSVLLVAVVLVGATWAYLSTATDPVNNLFSFLGDEGIDAELEEPSWSPELDGSDDIGVTKLVPGSKVPKDPLVINSGEIDEYLGLKLTFQTDKDTASTAEADKGTDLTANQMALLLSLIEIQYNSTPSGAATYVNGCNPQWQLIGSSGALGTDTNVDAISAVTQNWVFVGPAPATSYKYLVPGTVDVAGTDFVEGTHTYADLYNKSTMATVPIFDRIVFKDSINNEQYAWLSGDADYTVTAADATATGIAAGTKIPKLVNGFSINIVGAGVQASIFDSTKTADKAAIVKALDDLLKAAATTTT